MGARVLIPIITLLPICYVRPWAAHCQSCHPQVNEQDRYRTFEGHVSPVIAILAQQSTFLVQFLPYSEIGMVELVTSCRIVVFL
jgi:hypothetical protein